MPKTNAMCMQWESLELEPVETKAEPKKESGNDDDS